MLCSSSGDWAQKILDRCPVPCSVFDIKANVLKPKKFCFSCRFRKPLMHLDEFTSCTLGQRNHSFCAEAMEWSWLEMGMQYQGSRSLHQRYLVRMPDRGLSFFLGILLLQILSSGTPLYAHFHPLLTFSWALTNLLLFCALPTPHLTLSHTLPLSQGTSSQTQRTPLLPPSPQPGLGPCDHFQGQLSLRSC